MNSKQLIRDILDDKIKNADATFNAIMVDKARTALDIEKVRLTSDIFNQPKQQKP